MRSLQRTMIEIKSITLREIKLPLKEAFQISSGVEYERRILLLQLTNVDGIEGWSECVAAALPNYSPETIDTCWLALREWREPGPKRIRLRCGRRGNGGAPANGCRLPDHLARLQGRRPAQHADTARVVRGLDDYPRRFDVAWGR